LMSPSPPQGTMSAFDKPPAPDCLTVATPTCLRLAEFVESSDDKA
jgi:hypothetical protein